MATGLSWAPTDAVAKAGELEPDILIIEAELPRLSGIQAVGYRAKVQPRSPGARARGARRR